MQLSVLDAKTCDGHVADVPVQVSATSHWPAEARQTNVEDWKTSTHALLVPVQWSAASLSHAPPCEAPMQLVVLDAKTSVGHVADVPVQVSATSHCPAEARHTNVEDWKTSTHVLLVPVQWSAASLSHAPPCEVPMQLVVPDAKTSASHGPDVPIQVSAKSHMPAEAR